MQVCKVIYREKVAFKFTVKLSKKEKEVRFIGLLFCYPPSVNKKHKRKQEETTMTPITVCFIVIGIIGFLQVADDLGVWVRINRLYQKENAAK